MASKVNTRFVVILVGALLALALGVGALAAYSMRMSGERNISIGDGYMADAEQARAAGNEAEAQELITKAVGQYGRAIAKDQSRREWIMTWRDALLQTTPQTDVEYAKQYRERYMAALDRLATISPNDPAPQMDLVLAQDEFLRVSGGPVALAALAEVITRRVAALETTNPDAPTVLRLRALRGLAHTDRASLETVDPEIREQAREDMQAFYGAFRDDPQPFLEALSPNPTAEESEEFAEAARKDHARVAVGLVRWHLNERSVAQSEGRTRDATAQLSEARRVLERTMSDGLGYDRALPFLFTGLTIELQDIVDRVANPSEQMALRQNLTRDGLVPVFAAMQETPAQDLPLDQMAALAPWVGESQDRKDALKQAIERGVDATPQNPRRLRAAADAMRRLGDPERAIELYQAVRALPKPPLSLDGLILPDLKLAAAYAQVEVNLELHNLAREEKRASAAETYLAAARAARDVLEQESGVARRHFQLRANAEIAIAEGETTRAIRLLEEFRKEFGDSPEVLAQLANLLLRQGTIGEAKQILEKLVSAGRINTQGVLLLADIYRSEGDLDLSLQLLEDEARRSGSPEEFSDALVRARRLITIEEGGQSDDPIFAAAVRANEAVSRRDYAAATSILDRAERQEPEAATDLRFIVLRAQIDALSGDKPGAVRRLEAALTRDPENQTLARMLRQLSSDDLIGVRLAEIDASTRPEIEKALGRYSLLSSVGRQDEAMQALAEAEALEPNHPSVLDLRFTQALAAEDLAAAARIAARAGESDADGVDGRLYQGRLQMARGEQAEAVRTLRAAAELIPSSVQIRRYLGQALVLTGQIDEGVESLRRAYEAKRDNLQVLGDYVQALRQLGRNEEARAVLDPENDPSAPARLSRSITNLWLTLEAETGSRQRALTERRTYYRADLQAGSIADSPESRENALRLIELLVRLDELDEAEQVLASVQEHLSENEHSRVQAGLALGRAARLTDPSEARAAEAEAISRFRERAAAEARRSRSADPLLVVAGFAFDSGRYDLGIEILRSAVEYESEADRQVSRRLAGRLTQRASGLDNEVRALEAQAEQRQASDPLAGEAAAERAAQVRAMATAIREDAASVYTDILSQAGADADFGTALALAELRLQLGQLDRAAELIARVRAAQPDNLGATLLAAALAEQRNDRPAAARLYNQAVEKHAANFLPFYRRALFHSSDPGRRADVLFDLRRVAELRPSLIELWVLRYRVHMQSGDADAAFAALREGIEAARSNAEPLSRQLVQELVRTGRVGEAAAVASERARANPGDAYWLFTAGSLAKQRGAMAEAGGFFGALMELPAIRADNNQYLQAASLYLDALLSSDRAAPPDQITRLASLVESAEREGAAAISRDMLLARAYTTLPNQRSRVSEFIQRAYSVAARGSDSATPTQLLRIWFQDLVTVAGGGQAALDYVASLDRAIRDQKAQSPDADIPHPIFVRALVLQGDQLKGAPPSDLIARAQALLREADDDPIARYELHKRLSNLKYQADDIAGAAAEAEAALAINGQDLEMLNNVAFYLAKYLDRVNEAVPYAERAAQLGPDNADVLDTVGVVYMLSGDAPRAISTFELALRFARTQEQRLPANVHMADALIRSGDSENARRYIEAAERLLPIVAEGARSTYQPEVTGLRSRLDNL